MMDELQIFTEAKNQPDASARAAYLERVCAGSPEFRQRLELLLQLDESDNELLDKSAAGLLGWSDDSSEAHASNVAEDAAGILHSLRPLFTPSSREGGVGRLGNYEIVELIGFGGFGVVLKAVDERLQRTVALKVLLPALAATSPPRKRFLREARTAAAVRHENVVQIHAIEECPIPYLVMEYIEGQTLQQRFDEAGPFEAAEVVRLGLQIARGLEAAHAQGIVHRDIKPANILLETQPAVRVKLTDFGLARTADDASLTHSGLFAGTPMYMAPEQVLGHEPDHRADLFSLGSVLYTMCTGRPPFRAATTYGVLRRVAEDEPRPIDQIIPEIPVGLCRVIERLHAKRPEERFASIGEAIDALEGCLSQEYQLPRQPLRRNGLSMAVRSAIVVSAVTVAGLLLYGSGNYLRPSVNVDRRTASSESVSVTAIRAPELSAEQMAANLKAQLILRNPRLLESSIQLTTTNGQLTEAKISPSDLLHDLTPFRQTPTITKLSLWAHEGGGGVTDLKPLEHLSLIRFESIGHPISDLRPLENMPLEFLGLWHWPGGDLSPVRTMPQLRAATFGGCKLQDIEPLRGIPFRYLCLNYTQVSDISVLAGMPLEVLEIENTRISDLSPLRGIPLRRLGAKGSPIRDLAPLKDSALEWISIDFQPEQHEQTLRALRGLQTINQRPAAEFWNHIDNPSSGQ